ncbi:short chain dehydrogenase reductase [Colletotrichum karsti]|uniref:Short chain dehydrogenase reductase n=1 Tax=Colletotrichum karsti TaxID=1095194 RepID=A0A9P6I7S1_9PEZI|nr:short chain dehydrogenase reductase [Colletotrichum karsti]KAF9877430.1 short chain dehydrogenase reductase [Colletotrichum karsti]
MASLPPDHFVKTLQFTKRVHRDVYPAIDPSNPDLALPGKVVIVTGASRGIGGNGLVPAFAKAGVKAIVLVARSADRLHAVAAHAKTLNPALETLVCPTDITDEAAVKALFEQVRGAYGHADVLVNNAAVCPTGSLTETEPKAWWGDLATNITATYYPTHHFLLSLPSTSHGEILNIATAAHTVLPTMSSYFLSKLASLQLSAFVAAENPNVTAISVHPGLVATEMTLDMFRPFAFDTPALVGGTAVWLCGERARFLGGRFVACNWDVEDLEARREEVVGEGLLTVGITGRFGAELFE